MARPRITGLVVTLALTIASCGGDQASEQATTPPPPPATTTTTQAATTTPPTTTTTTTPVAAGPDTLEIRFRSDGFELVGDLILPDGPPPYPAVIAVAGSGPATRLSTPGYTTIRQKFGNAGFAVFSWDKPGSGESTGQLEREVEQRAAILVDAVDVLAAHPSIDPERIGMWGLSQAGWVMPLALDQTDDVAFLIVVSGGGEDGIEQLAFQVGRRLVCRGGSEEDGALVEEHGARARKAATYEEYRAAVEILDGIPGLRSIYPFEIASEEEWEPPSYSVQSFFDPMDVIAVTTIPVLAVYGELDKNIDPIQGAAAYRDALERAGNTVSHVEVIPGVGHTMLEQTTGCIGEGGGPASQRYLQLLDEWIAELADDQ